MGIIITLASCQKSSTSTSLFLQASKTAALGKINDANKITFVKIGAQRWMSINLDITHYRNGDKIPEVKTPAQWKDLTSGAWCWYNNDSATGAVYGRLYNWYAVNDPRGLAPEGWHVATQTEWNKLYHFLYKGGIDTVGGVLKEAGTAHWEAPNKGATNSTLFTALPAGSRFYGKYQGLNRSAQWWTSTALNTQVAYAYSIGYKTAYLLKSNPTMDVGLSVRCVKDKN